MSQAVCNEIEHVLIGKRVQHVFSIPLAQNDIFGAQNAEPLRDRGDRFFFYRRQLSNAERTLGEPGGKAEPCRIPHRAKNASASFDGVFVDRQDRSAGFPVIVHGTGGLFGFVHKSIIHSHAHLCK